MNLKTHAGHAISARRRKRTAVADQQPTKHTHQQDKDARADMATSDVVRRRPPGEGGACTGIGR